LDVSEGSRLPAVPLQSQREQTIAALCEHFSRDHLTVDEFERRLDLAHRVQTTPELTQLLQGLPALPAQPTAAPASSGRPMVSTHAREQQHFVAIMGGHEKGGVWQPAQKTNVYCLMGGVDLDYREALLPPGETELTIIAVMGGAQIVVPPDVRVECDGVAIMGGFDHGPQEQPLDLNAPVLRIRGFCLMGGVEVTVRRVGETAKEARKRRKDEKRLKRG
jgi:hypothetical protein